MITQGNHSRGDRFDVSMIFTNGTRGYRRRNLPPWNLPEAGGPVHTVAGYLIRPEACDVCRPVALRSYIMPGEVGL